MSTINQAITDRVGIFVRDLNELLREAAVQSIYDALESGGQAGARRGPGRPRGRAAAGAVLSAAAPDSSGGKRTADELESVANQLLEFIEQNPGLGVEQISKGMNVTSKELTLPIRKLLSAGKVSTKGQKRATKYFSGKAKAGRGRKS